MNEKKDGTLTVRSNDRLSRPLLTFGSTVRVSAIKGNISMLTRTGIITMISPPYCRVKIKYGRKQIGYWDGLINDVELISDEKR